MNAARSVRVAAAQYDIGFLSDWDAYRRKLTRWVEDAAASAAQVLVFPEYGAMELASLFAPDVRSDLGAQLAALQDVRADFLALHAALAARCQVHILASSFPVRLDDGTYRNRAHLFAPGGAVGYQDKLQMTRFESERWFIGGGSELRVFETGLGRFGVAICYDAEFPLLVHAQVEAGADIILVPSCTDTLAGYHRVRTSCMARALENQCYVIQAPTVGTAEWSEAVDVNVGAAGVFCPADRGLPDDGIIAAGQLNTPQWVYADLVPDDIANVRRNGQVLNYRDWVGQRRVERGSVRTVSLC